MKIGSIEQGIPVPTSHDTQRDYSWIDEMEVGDSRIVDEVSVKDVVAIRTYLNYIKVKQAKTFVTRTLGDKWTKMRIWRTA